MAFSLRRSFKLGILYSAKWLGLFRLARRLTRRGFVVIGWHGVSLGDEHLRFPNFFITPQTLRRRLGFLKRHFAIVSLDEVMNQHGEGRIEPNQVVLTFDDGMYDLKPAALPVLREHDATATVYLVSDRLLRPRTRALNFMLHEIFQKTDIEELPDESIPGLCQRRWSTPNQQRTASAACVRHVRNLSDYDQRYRYVRSVAEWLEVDLNAMENSRVWDILGPDEIHEMMSVLDFQLHSRRHLTATELAEDFEDDTLRCRRHLEGELQRDARDYAYPSGVWGKWCWPALARVGVRGAVTCKAGPNFRSTPALALRRYMDEEAITQLEFEAMVSNFLWLIHAVTHPRRWHEPTEARSAETTLY